MATILLLSGPNLNLLGDREPEIYGTTTLDDLVTTATKRAADLGHEIEHVQANSEGPLIDAIHGARRRCAAIVINPGALTHYAREHRRRARGLRRADHRAAPLQHTPARAVATHLGGVTRRDRR